MNALAWDELRLAAARLTENSRHSRRMANLSMVAAAVHAVAVERTSRRHTWDGAALAEMLPHLALHALPSLRKHRADWTRLAAAAKRVAPTVTTAAALEAWVARWQAADEGRKSQGAYATPTAIADHLARLTLASMAGRKPVRVVDPSAGAGALLLAALRVLSEGGGSGKRRAVALRLHGAELDPDARELCCHLIWLACGADQADLALIASNIVPADALSHAWWAVSAPPAFDALLMNPPWESLRQALPDGHPGGEGRVAIAERLSAQLPGAAGLPPLFSAQGRGDRNLFKGFVELAPHLLRLGGRLGALIPAALASDAGMAPLRSRYLQQMSLERWSVIENVERHFPIDSRYKFGILVGARSDAGTASFGVRGMCTRLLELEAEHVVVRRRDLELLGGPGCMIPEVRTQGELDILSHIAASGSPFFADGSFGKVRYTREVDLTLDRAKGLFERWEDCTVLPPRKKRLSGGGPMENPVPLVEGRMVGQYDFFKKSWVSGSGRTARWETNAGRPLAACRPQFAMAPRRGSGARVAICDVTSATNTRTVHATLVPDAWWCGNTAPVLVFEDRAFALAGLAALNSMVFDWIARRLVSGLHLNKFYLEAMWWPRLGEAEIRELASAAYTLSAANPRFCAMELDHDPAWSTGAMDVVEAHVLIEATMARGFDLPFGMLAAMLDENRAERRGLWRFFAAESWAIEVRRRLLAGFEVTSKANRAA